MSILNYFFIGVAFAFLMDLLLASKTIRNHPKMKKIESWGVFERFLCVTIWPIASIIFIIAFTKEFFKK